MGETEVNGEPILSYSLWMAEEDFKVAMTVLKNDWKFVEECTYSENEEIPEDQVDKNDPEYYEIVQYYENGDNGAEVYFADKGKKKVSDIRFWMAIDKEERERFNAEAKSNHPEWKDSPDPLITSDPYRCYMYHKALNRV